ncbi:MAG: mechanosensitive ion channel domain-containing protein, partial [Pirellulales bacterium]
LALYEYEDRRLELGNLKREVKEKLADYTGERPEELEAGIRDQLKNERDLIDELIDDGQDYFRVLLQLNAKQQELIDKTNQYASFIDERALWIRSDAALGVADLQPAIDAAKWVASPDNWRQMGRQLRVAALSGIGWVIGFLIAYIPLLASQRFLRRKIDRLGSDVQRRSQTEFGPTAKTLGLTLLIAATWPALLGFVAWRLHRLLLPPGFVPAVATALGITTAIYYSIEVLRQICRGHGLAEAHFGWSNTSLAVVRRNTRWLLFAGLPLVFVAKLLYFQQQEPLWSSSLGRAAFVLFLILLAIYLQRILHPVRGAMQQVRLRSSRGWFYRTRYAWYPLAFGSPLSLAILTAIGYYDTARTLAAHLFATAFLVLALAILRGLLSRWLLLSRRKLGMQQLQQRREAARAAANSDAAVSGAAIAESEELELDLATLSDQTRRLINATIVLLGTMVAWTVWDDVFPAFKILDSVRFRGGTIPLTLADVLLGIAALGLTYVAARNLPGLFEFTVLRHLPVDAGTRYAMTTVCQYLLAMAGVAISGTLLGITWDSIQWLVAAMAVGLGFGLQEIFANFVSGMILLFERPIRVGDVVTLGDTTGTVTRIRFRATTIKDWDRKEYIVPNKDLVTGRVLNWTLTDQTSRVVISVGIAYGSDTGQACRLLKKVAHDHPIVLDDPPPMATFEGFGDSVLNLILRCYLPDLEHRLTTIHQLHTAVDRTFREADIEIAFPQRDLHIRTVNQALVQETAP